MTDVLAPTEIDLGQFAEIVNNARTDNNTCLVASYDDGYPDVALKGSMMVFDKDHLAFWEWAGRETFAKIKAQPLVCVLVRNPTRDRRTIRLYGEARVIADTDPLREAIWDRVVDVEKQRDPDKKGAAVLIRVDRMRAGGTTPMDVRRT